VVFQTLGRSAYLSSARGRKRRRPLAASIRMTSLTRLLVLATTAAAVAALAPGCVHDGGKPEGPRIEPITVEEGASADVPYVVGDRLFGMGGTRPAELAAAVNTMLLGTLAPAVVPARSGAAFAYNTFRGRRPVLRVRRGPGADSVLDEGAHSVAWSRAGGLAYFKATSADLRDPRRYLGHVVVRRSTSAPATARTPRPGRYVVAAWAQGSVLAYRLGTSFPDLVVLDGPRRQRVLARASALVAVSPDGRRAFVSSYGLTPPVVRLLDVASSRELSRLRVDRQAAAYVLESGSWVEDRVFAATTTGVVVFRVMDDAVELDRVLRTEHEFPTGILEPRGLDGGRRVVMWGELASQPREAIPRAALVECEVATFRCSRVAVASSAAPPRPVYNPSRP
jgi:hypothetical protein